MQAEFAGSSSKKCAHKNKLRGESGPGRSYISFDECHVTIQ